MVPRPSVLLGINEWILKRVRLLRKLTSVTSLRVAGLSPVPTADSDAVTKHASAQRTVGSRLDDVLVQRDGDGRALIERPHDQQLSALRADHGRRFHT